MAKDTLLKKCYPCSVVVQRLNPADILKWKNPKKSGDKRRPYNRWKRGLQPRRRKKNSGGSERSFSRSISGDSHKTNDSDVIKKNNPPSNADKTRPITENNDSLWKYKRKRSRSPSPDANDEFVAKRVPVNTTNLPRKKLKITLERLPVNDRSILQEIQLNNFDNNTETDGEVEDILNKDKTSSIMDNEIVAKTVIHPEEMKLTELNEVRSPDIEPPDDVSIKDEPSSSDEEDSETDTNEDRLTDLCLRNEAIVLVTRLEDVMDALENNYTVSDMKHLSEQSLDIIRSIKSSWNVSDDISYHLVMSPETEESINRNDLNDENDSDDSYTFTTLKSRPRTNRRRISSEGSSSSEDNIPDNRSIDTDKVPEEFNSIKHVSTPNKKNNVSPLKKVTREIQDNTSTSTEEKSISPPSKCPVCKEIFTNEEEQLNHVCSPLETIEKNSHKSPNDLRKVKRHKLNPKVMSLECNICSQKCESFEQLSDHIFKHTPREHQDAYRDAQRQSCDSDESSMALTTLSESDESHKRSNLEGINQEAGVAVILDDKKNGKSPNGKLKRSVAVSICPCHTDESEPTDLTVQIEMVLYCESCKVLFRRSHCFETHYRKNSKCNQDRRKGRSPRLFCSSCRVVLNTLSDMRKHLEKHASINRHGTVTFVCNICQVVFFGVGTVFCNHWLSHDKDPMFIASQHSFPKVYVSDHGRSPIGTLTGEKYLFVAQYVCLLCKQQFSSDGEKSSHECKHEEPIQEPVVIPPSLPQNSSKESSTPKANKSIATTPNSIELRADSPAPLQIDEGESDVHDEAEPEHEEMPVQKKKPARPPPVKRPPVQKLSIPDSPVRYSPTQNRNSAMNIWICDTCNNSFPNLRALGDHAPIHFTESSTSDNPNDPKKNYVCTICQYSCASLKLLGAHWGKHDLMRYTCSVCNECYSSFSGFSRHVIALCGKHNPTCRVSYGIKEFCKICQIVFKDAKYLESHNSLKHSTNNSIENCSAVEGSKEASTAVETNNPPVLTNELAKTTTLAVPSAIEPATIPLVLCLQPTNIIEPTAPLNNYFINIAIPNTATTPVKVPDNVIAVPPQKPKALEDPMVQVVVTQSTLLNSTVSASLVTNPLPLTTAEPVAPSASTFTLMVRDTTTEVITNELTIPAPKIINNNPVPANVDKPVNSGQIEKSNQANDVNSNDELEIIELASKGTKEVKKNVPLKILFTPKTPRVSSDSDIEILKEVAVPEEAPKPDEKIAEEKTGGTTDESSEASGETNLVANPLSRPKGFLRVKNLAELRDNTNKSAKVSGNGANVNTLTQHLLASLETIRDPAEGKSVPESNKGYTPGKRTLPYIPQRIIGQEVRRVNPLSSRPDQSTISKPMNRVTPIPTTNNNIIITANEMINQSNNQEMLMNPMANSQQRPTRARTYTCPMCTQSQFNSLDKFVGHLYQHPDMPPNVQELVRYLMNRNNAPRRYPDPPQSLPKPPSQNPLGIQQTLLQTQIHPQPNNSVLVSQDRFSCPLCSNYETDSQTEFQKHMTNHSQQVVNSQNQCTTSVYQRMTNYNSFQSGFNQIYEQRYQLQMQNVQQTQATQQINSIPSQSILWCNMCANYQCLSQDELRKHMQVTHNITSNRSELHVCQWCPRVMIFPSDQELRIHEDAQHPFRCSVCFHRFNIAYDLNAHRILHLQNGQYSNNFYSNQTG